MIPRRLFSNFPELMQLELFQRDPYEHLFPYWRERLDRWPTTVFEWRHHRYTTGWSMATQQFFFAEALFRQGQLTREQFRRFLRFERRVRRWDKMPERD